MDGDVPKVNVQKLRVLSFQNIYQRARIRRPKYAMAYRAVGETRSDAENAALVLAQCRPYQMESGPNFRVSAR